MNMATRALQLGDDGGLKQPLVWSTALHAALFGTVFLSAVFTHQGASWGGPGGDQGVTVGLVKSLPGIPLPRPEVVTTNRVVDTSKGLYKDEPKPKEQDTTATQIPQFEKEKPPKYVTRPSRPLPDESTPPPNAIPYGGGGSPSVPYSTPMQLSGATAGGLQFGGPGGGAFSGRFPTYVDGVRARISSNWLQSTVDPSVRWAPRVVFTFEILHDGSIVNAQMMQSSGNASVDNSALRAIMASSPLGPLPSGYSGSNVTVQFWFDFRR
ncbi:MAG: TonB family protein [Candidatus Acidiferrales bacterium]